MFGTISAIRIVKYQIYNFIHRTFPSITISQPIFTAPNSTPMNKESIQETLRKSKEVEERYKKFLAEKEQSDKQWAITQAKIDKTLDKLAETKETIKQIDQLYENYQKSFEKTIDAALEKIQANKLIETQDANFVPKYPSPKEIAELIKKKKRVIFMTGAGVSAASGIPTFRDKDGYWTKKKLQNISPEQFLTFSNYEDKPFEIWQWLEDFYKTKMKCKPNKGHVAIDTICNWLIQKKAQTCIITQNVDNFHVESQSKPNSYPIYAVHGNILKIRCDICAKDKPEMICFPYKNHRQAIIQKKPAECPKCKLPLRPHIMFFDQFYQEKFHHSKTIEEFTEQADLLIVVGTALQTGLARMTVERCLKKGIEIVEINTECMIRQNNVLWMQGNGEEFLSKIANQF